MSHDAFRAGVEAQDLGAMVDALSPDVVFHSPITFKPFEGKEAVSTLLGVVTRPSRTSATPTSWRATVSRRWCSRRGWATSRFRASTCCGSTTTG